MSYEAESDLVRARWNTGWTAAFPAPNAIPWWGDNVTAAAAVKQPWVRFVIRNAPAHLASVGKIGDPYSPVLHRHLGVVVVQCFVPKGESDDLAMRMADAAIAIFSGESDPGITYHGPSGEAPSRETIGLDEGGLHFQVNAYIPFYRDTSK